VSGFDEHAGHTGLRTFTISLAALFVVAVILGAGVAWLVR
jgi:hypothetical protein